MKRISGGISLFRVESSQMAPIPQFLPPRREGVIFQAVASVLLAAAGGSCFAAALQAPADSGFLFYLLMSILLVAPLPLLLYRLYSLLGASYRLERDGLRLHWGLRYEDVPLPEIEWVRPAEELAAVVPGQKGRRGGVLPLPWLHWPGALIGTRSVEGLGTIEFLASGTQGLLLVAAARKIYAISPADPAGFIRAFRRQTELGSLAPIRQRSVYPTVMLSRIWTDLPARTLVFAGLGVGLALLAWVGLIIPTRAALSVGFSPAGAPLEPSSSDRLLLLPVLYGFAYGFDLLAGVYFYRRRALQPVAYILWSAAVICGLTLLIAVGFILRT